MIETVKDTNGQVVEIVRCGGNRWGQSGQHCEGGFYWNDYWRKTYKVLSIQDGSVECLWSDGERNTHRTPLHPKDGLVVRINGKAP